MKFLKQNINKILLVTDKENIHLVENMYYKNNKIQIIEGGIKRIDSVSNALKLVDTKYVIIHDSARCFISENDINNLLNVTDFDALYACKKVTDTIRKQELNEYNNFNTLNRNELLIVETPQIFNTNILKKEMNNMNNNIEYTDEISLLENKNYKVIPCLTNDLNIKLTNINDLNLLTLLGDKND
jgi:2-C-methyl-D-erythritol 4-phosphate cytidylyltransferase